MERASAQKIVEALLTASGALNESVRIVQIDESEATFHAYRRQAAEVMAAIYLDLLKPIVRDYPDLDPGAPNPD